MPHNNGNRMSQLSIEDIKQFMEQLGPAAIGTAASMLFTEGRWKKRLVQGIVGVPFSMYMAPSVYTLLQLGDWTRHISEPSSGVLTAVFGLAAVSYVFELWKQMNLGPILRDVIVAWADRLKPSPRKESNDAGNKS